MAPTSTISAAPLTPTASDRMANDERNLQLAIHHATLLQQRKDTEASVLSSLEKLIDFPLDPESTSFKPASSDLQQFKELIVPFRVSDYDALIEERHCAEKCGYVLCPNSLKRKAPPGNYSRIVRGNRSWGSTNDQELRVVPSAKFEMWCDEWCARAALYIKVQLSEVPAWERVADTNAGTNAGITVLSTDLTWGELESDLTRIGTSRRDSAEVKQMMEELALERGERSAWPAPSGHIPIRERPLVVPPQPPVRQTLDGQAGEIEGYTPQHQPPRLAGVGQIGEIEGSHLQHQPPRFAIASEPGTPEEDSDWDFDEHYFQSEADAWANATFDDTQ